MLGDVRVQLSMISRVSFRTEAVMSDSSDVFFHHEVFFLLSGLFLAVASSSTVIFFLVTDFVSQWKRGIVPAGNL